MADNVDISLKLGTEADLSSAISAGARAGAAFAAAAQNAVSGIQLNAGATMRAFQTSSSKVSSSSDVTKEIRSLGLTTGLIAQMAVQRLAGTSGGNSGNGGGWGNKPFAPIFPEPGKGGKGGLPDNIWSGTYYQRKQTAGETQDYIDAEWAEVTEKSVKNIDKLLTKAYGGNGGRGGGRGGFWSQMTGGWGETWGDLKPGFAAAKVAEALARPAAEYFKEYYSAEYKAATTRSSKGLMEEKLEKDIALRNMKAEYGMFASAGAGAALGSVIAPGIGTIIGGAIGGIAGLINKTIKETENVRETEELKQQFKTLGEVQKREAARSLFGGAYSVGYAKTFEEMGLGGSESQVMAMSSNALTFRGRQAFGQVGLHEYTMMAQVPNYFAAVNNGVTDPQVLHSLLKADLNNLGDPQMAAYIASQLPGIGLDTYASLNSRYYGQTFSYLHSRMIRGEDRGIADISAGYMNKNARNAVLNRALEGSEMRIDAYQAPKSMYAGYKPTQEQYEQDLRDKRMITQAVMQDNTAYAGNNYTINVIVDDEVVKTETVKDRDFIMGGMSYTAGGN